MARRLVVAVAFTVTHAWLILARQAASASVCNQTGEPAPDVVTVIASKTKPATDAWVVSPNCSVEVVTVAADGLFSMGDLGIRRVISVPKNALSIKSNRDNFDKGANFSAATNTTSLMIQEASASTLDFVFPTSLKSMILHAPVLQTIDNFDLPEGFTDLQVWSSQIATLKNVKLPSGLQKINVWTAKIVAVDFAIPPNLEELVLNDNTIVSLENFTLPKTMKKFSCSTCGTTTVRGIRWPSSLETLSLIGNPLTNVEIRESDVKIFQRFDKFADLFSQPSCADSTATRVPVGVNFVCVITDARFESKYEGIGTTSPSRTMTPFTETAGPSPAPVDSTDTKSNAVLVAVVSAVGGLFVLASAVIGFVFFARKKKQQEGFKATTGDEIAATDGDSSQDSEVATDFRNDKIITAMRIEQSDLTVGKLVAQGGYGVIYSGFCRGRQVAIKQMLPNAWRENKKLDGFIDEIRLCANLDYPKIVEFIGVAWSSLRDLSAVIEFMNGGDLHSLIHKYPETTGTEWSQPWTPMGLQSKSLMAMDVAEAVVYLHSFSSIIIHRDLKAKNVLLDELGNAKLSDFGISREVPIDETMTSEIGTVAWIAPEVLRGGRYSEKADIYSLGVLLVELDRCCHPYAHLDESAMGSARYGTDSLGHTHMQIALLVSTGQLRPSVSRQCPSLIASLVDRCLQYDPAERPTAMEVFYALRQSRKYSL